MLGKVTSIYINNSDRVLIETDQQETNLDCSAVSDKYVSLSRTHKGFHEIYSAMLSAQSNDKLVKIRISPGSEGCTISYVVIYR